MASGIHQTVETFAVELRLDLLGIGRGNGRDRVRIDKTALEEVRVLIGFQLVRCEIIAGKTCDILDIPDIPFALELQIVDRHDSLDPLEELAARKPLFEIDGHQTGLPVVAVDQVGVEIDGREHRQDSFGEECKPGDLKHGIIGIGLVAGKEALIVDEVKLDPIDLGL